jgi:HPt (histidine-containing phosphotransfer) domain-containing protein
METRDTIIESTLNSLIKAESSLQLPKSAIKRLFLAFLKSGVPLSQELLEVAKADETTTLKEKAHALRGVALSLQFKEIANYCHKLEYETDQDRVLLSEQVYQNITLIELHQENILLQFSD